MTSTGLDVQQVDAAIRFGGLLLRALAYAAVYAIAGRYDCGAAILTGVLAGDLGSRLAALSWQWREEPLQSAAELALLGIVLLCVRSQMTWPDDQALRAIVGLTAFGVFTAQFGGTVLVRLGPARGGFE